MVSDFNRQVQRSSEEDCEVTAKRFALAIPKHCTCPFYETDTFLSICMLISDLPSTLLSLTTFCLAL